MAKELLAWLSALVFPLRQQRGLRKIERVTSGLRVHWRQSLVPFPRLRQVTAVPGESRHQRFGTVEFCSLAVHFRQGRCDAVAGLNVTASSSSSVERAEAVREALREKLDAARARLVEIDASRAELAYEAHSAGGDAARELTKLNKARVVFELDIQNLESALLESSRRIDAAQREEALADGAVKALRRLRSLRGLMARAKRLDEALAFLAEEGNLFRQDLRELNHRLACSHPNEHQLQSLGERAIKSALMFSPFRIEHLRCGTFGTL
jgi:hypothetical protein